MRKLILACALLLWGGLAGAQDFIRYYPAPVVGTSGGGATFTAPVLFSDGTATAPGIAFSSDPRDGFSRVSTPSIALNLGGATRYVFESLQYYAAVTDVTGLGVSSRQWTNAYFSRSIQGSKSKTLTDNVATAFATMAMPQTAGSNYGGGQMIYTIFCKDATNQAQQSGTVKFVCMNLAGTESCGFGTPDGVTLGDGTAGLGTPTFTAAAGADLVTISVQSDCTGVAPTTHTIQVRFDLQQPNTLAFP
jgi:hypothetical protein